MKIPAASLAFLLLSAAAASGADCPAPRFAVSELNTGPDDAGFWGGVSLADTDGDGDLDLMMTNGYDTTVKFVPLRSMLYLNNGHGSFRPAPDSGLALTIPAASGTTWADIDGDGRLDVFITTELAQKDVYVHNEGGARFTQMPLGDATETKGGNFSGTWADLDGDGDLDLYAGGPALEPAGSNLAYRNDAGRFVAVTGTPLDNGKSNGAAVLAADLDNDGDQDVFVANSDISRASGLPPATNEAPLVLRNDGNWTFVTSEQPFTAADHATQTAAFGDIDNDGDLDLFAGLWKKPDLLFRNDGHGRFEPVAGFAGPPHGDLAGGAAFADFDNDGDLDLIFADYDIGISLYMNDGAGNFTRVNDPALDVKAPWSSVAAGDIDGDGRMDVIFGKWGEKREHAVILRNTTPRCGAWTRIALTDTYGAVDPPGARVTLVTRRADGTVRRQMREASAQTTFRGQGAHPFHFGIPKGEKVARAEIRWPDGRTRVITRVPLNRTFKVTDATR